MSRPRGRRRGPTVVLVALLPAGCTGPSAALRDRAADDLDAVRAEVAG